MSAVHKPNMNFDNEKKTHTPYREVAKASMRSAYEEFMRPKKATAVKKEKRKKDSNVVTDAKTFRKWFK
jgi:hypothetical protein